MNKFTRKFALDVAAVVVLGLVATFTIAADAKQDAQLKTPEMKLPPGWTEADMKAYAEASTPGKEQQRLAQDAGVWQGKNTMWMYPGADPVQSDCTYTVTPIMDGRYIKGEMAGEMPGMGPFTGFCITGFDNVSKQYACSWIDSASTGIMHGTGEASPDGKTLTWKFTFNCPITHKPTPMRQVETTTGPAAKTLEMWSVDPKSGKEYKMMRIEFTKARKLTHVPAIDSSDKKKQPVRAPVEN